MPEYKSIMFPYGSLRGGNVNHILARDNMTCCGREVYLKEFDEAFIIDSLHQVSCYDCKNSFYPAKDYKLKKESKKMGGKLKKLLKGLTVTKKGGEFKPYIIEIAINNEEIDKKFREHVKQMDEDYCDEAEYILRPLCKALGMTERWS